MISESNEELYDAFNSIKAVASHIEKELPVNQEDAKTLYDAVRKIKDILFW